METAANGVHVLEQLQKITRELVAGSFCCESTHLVCSPSGNSLFVCCVLVPSLFSKETVENLKTSERTKKIVQRIQELSRFGTCNEYVTRLLFIFSPCSRLIEFYNYHVSSR